MLTQTQQLLIRGRILNAELIHSDFIFTVLSNENKYKITVNSCQYSQFQVGDIVEVLAEKLEEKQMNASTIQMLTNTNTPGYFDGSKDLSKEENNIPREIILLRNDVIRSAVVTRSHVLNTVRSYFLEQNFLEFETPILLRNRDIAPIEHFETWSTSTENHYYLRICPESYLKRLLVSGFERVFEIGKNFRDEAKTHKNSPEFSVIECYQAYANYLDMAYLTENLISHVAKTIHGSTKVFYRGEEIDLSPPWNRISFIEATKQYFGIDISKPWTTSDLCLELKKHGIECSNTLSYRDIINLIAETFIEPNLTAPTFLMDHPSETIAVAKRHTENSDLIERFEGFICGVEIAHGFSELTNPYEQRSRMIKLLEEEACKGEKGYNLDEEFLTALEVGLPPTGGLGIGIDRLVMLMTDLSIDEVKAF